MFMIYILVVLFSVNALDLSGVAENSWVTIPIKYKYIDGFENGRADFRSWSRLKYNRLNNKFQYYEGFNHSVFQIPQTIYGNTLYSLDICTDTSTMLTTSNWRRPSPGVWINPDSNTHPKPFDRHTYGAFMFCDYNNTTYLAYGAHSGMLNMVRGVWAFDQDSMRWRKLDDSPIIAEFNNSDYENQYMYMPRDSVLYLTTRSSSGLNVWSIDLKTDSIKKAASQTFSQTLWGAMGTPDTLRKRFVFFGGRDGVFTNTLCAYYPDSAKFVRITTKSTILPEARVRPGFTYIAKHDIYFLHGGQNTQGSDFYTDSWIYDPKTDVWQQVYPENPSMMSRYLDYDYANDVIAGIRLVSGVGLCFIALKFNPVTSGIENKVVRTRNGCSIEAYPNPFNPELSVNIEIPVNGSFLLSVYTLGGKKVAKLQEGELTKGTFRFIWNGKTDNNLDAATGAYIIALESKTGILQTKRVLLTR